MFFSLFLIKFNAGIYIVEGKSKESEKLACEQSDPSTARRESQRSCGGTGHVEIDAEQACEAAVHHRAAESGYEQSSGKITRYRVAD